jgi:hypothetical protein
LLGKHGPITGAQLPTLVQTHSPPPEYLKAAARMALFKGKVENLTVDVMVIEGDRDPLLKGNEARRVAAVAGPSLQKACDQRGLCAVGGLRVTPGYGLPCQQDQERNETPLRPYVRAVQTFAPGDFVRMKVENNAATPLLGRPRKWAQRWAEKGTVIGPVEGHPDQFLVRRSSTGRTVRRSASTLIGSDSESTAPSA